MADQLVGLSHFYGGSGLTINTNAPGCCLNDILSIFIHPHTHNSIVIECRWHFFYTILKGEAVDIAAMIYMTIVFHFTTFISPIFITLFLSLGMILPYSMIFFSLCKVVLLFDFHTSFLIVLLRILLSPLTLLILLFHLDLFFTLLLLRLILISLIRCILFFYKFMDS